MLKMAAWLEEGWCSVGCLSIFDFFSPVTLRGVGWGGRKVSVNLTLISDKTICASPLTSNNVKWHIGSHINCHSNKCYILFKMQ